jgi:hypothetical protein
MPPTIEPQQNEKQEKEIKSHPLVKRIRAGIHYVGKATTFKLLKKILSFLVQFSDRWLLLRGDCYEPSADVLA